MGSGSRLLALVVLAASACGSGDRSADGSPSPPTLDRNASYVITAIDYHFHDAHPSAPLGPERAVVFSNQGSNIHNVTIPGTDFDRDIRPGDRLTVGPIGSILAERGDHPFYCRFHRDRGMVGVLVIVGPDE